MRLDILLASLLLSACASHGVRCDDSSAADQSPAPHVLPAAPADRSAK